MDLDALRLDLDDIALPGRRGAKRVARGASSSESEVDEDDEGGARPLGCVGGGMYGVLVRFEPIMMIS